VRGREHAKRAVCQANLKRLMMAWHHYADENNGWIVNGNAGEAGGGYSLEACWVQQDYRSDLTHEARTQAILDGALWPYVWNLGIYRCPHAGHAETRSYSIVDAMNVKAWNSRSLGDAVTVKQRSEVTKPGVQVVFLDSELSRTMGGFTCYKDEPAWWDPPSTRHAQGLNLAFMDGHVEHWKWQDPRSLGEIVLGAPQPGNPDIHRIQKAIWGDRKSLSEDE